MFSSDYENGTESSSAPCLTSPGKKVVHRIFGQGIRKTKDPTMTSLLPHSSLFSAVHGGSLIYNTCWEDPRLDRVALNLTKQSRVLVITSAGCNALDYALAGAEVTAVDLNYRQNALLELKLQAARYLTQAEFFALFGKGVFPKIRELYHDLLQKTLTDSARVFWDRHWSAFLGTTLRRSFYFFGTVGFFARLINLYIDAIPRARRAIESLLHSRTIEEQRHLYTSRVKPLFWGKLVSWLVRRNATLALLGVPPAQRRQVERYFPGGIASFIEHCLDTVFGELPLRENYFWRVYLTGSYNPDCCPEYLRRENFIDLKSEVQSRVTLQTTSVASALRSSSTPFSHIVLLDHMDWLASHDEPSLIDEWEALLENTQPGARVIWRSGGLQVEYVDSLPIQRKGARSVVGDHLTYHTELANRLHREDRVHTYGSFYIAEVM